MAILATFPLLKHRLFDDTLKIAKILLKDSHHLIHKATGWMLREIGKINQEVEEEFLQEHKSELSRTTLRYAIEKFPEDLRQEYLKTKQKNVNSNKQ
jgi:3-methyladenine DNA glycosylase AlkD